MTGGSHPFARLVRLLVVAALGLAPSVARTQVVASERVVAVVGSEPILLSEVEEQAVIAASQQGLNLDDEAAVSALRRRVLDQMVNDLILVAAASADDSVDVSENTVNEAVEAELNEIRARFPSQAEFEREIARSQWRTLENYRRNLRRIKRRELLVQAFLSRHTGQLQARPVTDEEVRSYYEQNRASIGTKPVTVRIQRLDIVARASEPARERARALADSLVGELHRGADFAALARQYSADSASAAKGGDLGYFGKGAMMAAFEQAAFGIDSIGGLAGPVETPFGFHIIRLDDRQGQEIRARHVLIAPAISDADRAAARSLGEALVDSLARGAEFEALRRRHSEEIGRAHV